MAEYYAVLSKAVAGLEPNAPETRRAVYDKARNALIGQLKAIDPPLPTSEISRQRLELEEAIRRVERESSAAPVSTPVRPATPRAAAVAPAPRAPAPVQAPPPAPIVQKPQAPEAQAPVPPAAPQERRSPQDMFRRAIQDSDRTRAAEPRSAAAVAPTVAATGRGEAAWKVEPAVDRAPPAARTPHFSAAASDFADEPPLRGGEPSLAPSYQDDNHWDDPEPAVDPVMAGAPRVDVESRPKGTSRLRRARSDEFADDVAQRARPSRLPGIILAVLILALIGGIGAFAYSQRAFVSGFVGDIVAGLDAGTEAPQQPAAVPPQAVAENGAGKDPDRLLGGGEAPAAPADDIRVVTPSVDGSAAAPQQVAAAPAPSAGDAGPLVAQRAILYEEPVDAAADSSGVIAVNAAVTWRYDPNGIDGPEVVGNVDVPERNLSLRMTLRRNVDDTLPASHIIEVVTDAKSGFPGRSVRDIPRLVLKASEEARGQPLIGASAKVADGFFWIALSGVPVDVSANLELLRGQSWIDLPIVYETGQRAILTFEKGTPGERAFQSALSAWAGQG